MALELVLLLYFNLKIMDSGKEGKLLLHTVKVAHVGEVFKLLSSGFY